MSSRLIEFVEHLPRKRIVLVGDLMVDRYIYGNAERLSPEAPVPVLHFKQERSAVGGAGNVAADLSVLGAEVRVIGVIGDDEPGRQVRRLLGDYGCQTQWVIPDPARPTITKMRLVGLAQHRHPQQMMRLDYEDASDIGAELGYQVIDHVTAVPARAGGATWSESVSLANVAGGLEVERFGVVPITKQEIIQELLSEAHEHGGKQRSLDQLLNELAYHRACGRRIVFTTGCFDLIHL